MELLTNKHEMNAWGAAASCQCCAALVQDCRNISCLSFHEYFQSTRKQQTVYVVMLNKFILAV